MFGLPMDVVAPVFGIGSLIMIVSIGIVMVRLVTSKIRQQELKAAGMDPAERDRLLEDIQTRLGELDQVKERIGELEERLDFTERLLASQRDAPRLGPSKE